MGSLIKRIVNTNNEIDKKNIDNTLTAFKKIPKTLTRERKKVKYGAL